jgi:hypothetical protein
MNYGRGFLFIVSTFYFSIKKAIDSIAERIKETRSNINFTQPDLSPVFAIVI